MLYELDILYVFAKPFRVSRVLCRYADIVLSLLNTGIYYSYALISGTRQAVCLDSLKTIDR